MYTASVQQIKLAVHFFGGGEEEEKKKEQGPIKIFIQYLQNLNVQNVEVSWVVLL